MDKFLHRSFSPQNKEEFYRYYLAFAQAKMYISNLSEEDRKKINQVKQERLAKEYYDTLTSERYTIPQCEKELYLIRLSEYKSNFLRDGVTPTREQRIQVRKNLIKELAEAQVKLPFFVADYAEARREVAENLRKSNMEDRNVSRRDFLKIGLGITGLALTAKVAEKLITSEPGNGNTSHNSNDINTQDLTSISPESEINVEQLKSNPDLLKNLGFSSAVYDNLRTYMDLGGDDENLAHYISDRIIREKVIMNAKGSSNGTFDSPGVIPPYTPTFTFDPIVNNTSLGGEISVTYLDKGRLEKIDYYDLVSNSQETQNAVNALLSIDDGYPNEALNYALAFAIQPLIMQFDSRGFSINQRIHNDRQPEQNNELEL